MTVFRFAGLTHDILPFMRSLSRSLKDGLVDPRYCGQSLIDVGVLEHNNHRYSILHDVKPVSYPVWVQ